MNMVKIAKKFAIPWSISVDRKLFERAKQLQMKYEAVSYDKLRRKFSMSDLGVAALNIGLGALEELSKDKIQDMIADKKIAAELISIQVKNARKGFKSPKTLSNMTDEQVEKMLGDNEQ